MITEIARNAEGIVLQQVAKPDGAFLRYQYGKPGDASSIVFVNSLEEGKAAIALPIKTVVDRNGDLTVRKVTKNGKCQGYEYEVPGNGYVLVKTLAEARKGIGKK